MAENESMVKPYQGKDLVSKVLSNTFSEKSFSVYGLTDLPAIRAYLPSELPVIEATDRMADHIFLLQDGSYAIVDYESEFKSINKVKYVEYAARLFKRYFDWKNPPKIRIIVIYTGDVNSADASVDAGALKLDVEQAFLTHIDGKKEYEALKVKIEDGQELTSEDQMKLIIVPLTQRGKAAKLTMIDGVIELAKKIKKGNDEVCSFVLSAMYVALGNYITSEQENKIKEVLDMTALGQRYVTEWNERIANENEATEARTLINSVNNVAANGEVSHEEACRLVGITPSAYENAERILQNTQMTLA